MTRTIYTQTAIAVLAVRQHVDTLFQTAKKADLGRYNTPIADAYLRAVNSISFPSSIELDSESQLVSEHRGTMEILGYFVDIELEILALPVKVRGAPGFDGVGKVTFRARGKQVPFFVIFIDANGNVTTKEPIQQNKDPEWHGDVRDANAAVQLMLSMLDEFAATIQWSLTASRAKA
jgi:hypothetical protein